MQNPDPARFKMTLFPGLKAYASAEAPDVEVPECIAHGRWPCIDCGTKHFDECECPYCVEPTEDKHAEVREAAGYAVGIIRGMLFHWKKAGIGSQVQELERYAEVLTRFSNGDL